jgi:transposase-like protein
MLDVPIAARLDDSLWVSWLERHLPPAGFTCAHCGRPKRRVCRDQGPIPAYRCRACDGDSTRLTGTVFEKTSQRPATLVRLRRGMAKGEPPARLARELGLSRQHVYT